MVTLADKNLHEIGYVKDANFTADVNGEYEFSVQIARSNWYPELNFSSYIYIVGTEYGGIIGEILTDTTLDYVEVKGLTYILAGIGVLAFLVSVIVQAIKEMPALKKVQTNVVALITSLILTPAAVIVLCTYYQIVIEWYYIFASFIAAFIVYLVSTGGWERVTEMWNRNAYKKK